MLLEDVGTYLQTNGVGTLTVDLFRGLMPPEPDNCVAIYEYAGKPRQRFFGETSPLENPGLQVKVRNKSYQAARQKLEEVINLLDGKNNFTLGTTKYLVIEVNQGIVPLGQDANNRVSMTVNFSIQKEVG